MKFAIKGTEIIVGKEENAGNQYFVFFPKEFSKGLLIWCRQNSGLCGIELTF